MKYVESIATKMGKKTEYVDSSLTEVFSSNPLSVALLSYGSCIAEVILPSVLLWLLLLSKVGIPVIGILAKGLLYLSHLLSKSVVLLIIRIVIFILIAALLSLHHLHQLLLLHYLFLELITHLGTPRS